jgi:Asp-tRNA(Asn)/Glu-tRNA(Gln) amidotransferase A subunit family amidase
MDHTIDHIGPITKTVADNALGIVRQSLGPSGCTPDVLRQLDLSGHPALTVPGGTGQHELPLGLQIIGAPFGDDRGYQAGFALEAALAG